jgi:hypothetical protein
VEASKPTVDAMMNMQRHLRQSMTFRLVSIPIATLLLASACGGSSKPKASSTPDQAAARQQITQNWESFFAKTTTIPQKVALLQNGQAMQGAVNSFAKDPRVGQTTAKVSSVQVTGAYATVHYQVLLNNQVMLPNAIGDAVYENGKWKVADQTICGLLSLASPGKTVAGC